MMSVSIQRKTTKQYLQEYFVVGGVYDETTRLFFYRRESMYFTKEKGGSDRLSSCIGKNGNKYCYFRYLAVFFL